jgi:glycosyltransferase involved in cell wall biosynthesis
MLKERAIESGHMPNDRVWVVRSFPDLNRFRRSVPDPTLRKAHKHLVGYVGIMAEQDGVELLVRAMGYVLSKFGRNDIGCIIVGDGPQFDQLRALAIELGLHNNVEFTGYLSGEAFLSALSSFDIGVIPDPSNVCNDKLSMNKVFEYMALGIPFVQFNLKQAKLDSGEAAVVVHDQTPEALAENIIELLGDEERRSRMSTYAMQHARLKFQWSSEKHSLLRAYRTLLPSPASADIVKPYRVTQR